MLPKHLRLKRRILLLLMGVFSLMSTTLPAQTVTQYLGAPNTKIYIRGFSQTDSNAYFASKIGVGQSTPVHLIDVLQSLSGSSANSAINIASTWNTTGVPTAFKLNVTNTASGAGSNLMDLQTGGTSIFTTTPSQVGITNNNPASKLEVTTNNLGITVTNASGITLSNNTAATAGVQSQYSPILRLRAHGWDNVGLIDRSVDWQVYATGTPGAGVVNSSINWDFSNNGAAYANEMNLTSTGVLSVNSVNSTGQIMCAGLTSSNFIQLTGGPVNNRTIFADGLSFNTGNPLQGGTGTTQFLTQINGTMANQTTGTAYGLFMDPTINLNANAVGVTIKGLYYNPILTNIVGLTTHNAIETVTGNVLLGSTSGNTLLGTSTDNGAKLQDAASLSLGVSVSAAGTLNLDNTATHWVASGTTSTWTLPAITGHTGWTYVIKNRGSGNLTINSNAGGNDIYNTSAVNTITVAAGAAIVIFDDGTFWDVKL